MYPGGWAVTNGNLRKRSNAKTKRIEGTLFHIQYNRLFLCFGAKIKQTLKGLFTTKTFFF
jgi:hypothetical protein